ncbi:hypothetical protein SLEP1_g60479, partial [Rubroshorea leprosula]
ARGSSWNPGAGFAWVCLETQGKSLRRSKLLGFVTNTAPGFVSKPRGRVCDEPAPGSRRTKLLGSSQSPGVGFVLEPKHVVHRSTNLAPGFVSKRKLRGFSV